MLRRITLSAIFALTLFFVQFANAITLTSGQSDYTTTKDITTTVNNTAGAGINSTQAGTSSAIRKIKNIHTITTSGSSAYGIRTTGDYNRITNEGTIITTNSTARGISVGGDFSTVTNSGSINTSGSSSYGIYVSAGSNSLANYSNYSTVTNSGSISAADSHGIYTNDNYTQITNSGTISSGDDTTDYGIRIDGNNSTLNNSGTISAKKYAIYNEGSDTIINNYGTLNGGVRTGSGTLNIFSGSISGGVDGSDSGIVNILGNFSQAADFSDLNSFNISSGTFEGNKQITTNNIFIDSGATLKLNSNSSVTYNEISGDGTLHISENASFAPQNDFTLGNILVGGTFDLSKTNDLTLTTNLTGSGSAIIDLGANNQKIIGNFSLNSGDTLKVSSDDISFGSLDVTGSTLVDANSKLIISSTNKYLKSGEKITLIAAIDGSALNNISNIEVNNCRANACGLLRINTEISGNNLIISVDHAKTSELSINQNSKNIYESLSENSSNSKAQEFLNYLDSKDFSNTELESTLLQLAPQSGRSRSIDNINVISNSLKTSEIHLDKIRSGTDSFPAFGSTNFSQILSPQKQLDSFNLNQQGGALKNGFWVQPFGGSALQKSTSNDIGYKTILSGIAFGVDRNFSPQLTSGASFSIARSETKSFDALKKTSALTYQLNFYVSQNFKEFFFDSLSGIAFSQYLSERGIPAANATAKASFNGASYIAKIRGGKIIKIDPKINLIPEISASFMQGMTQKYSEKGADSLSLNVNSINSKTLEGIIGGAVTWTEKIKKSKEFKKFVTAFKTSYGYNFINDHSDVNSSFSGQRTTFNSQTSPIDPGSLKIGIEITGYQVESTIFSLDYQLEKRSTYQSHFAALKVLQEF